MTWRIQGLPRRYRSFLPFLLAYSIGADIGGYRRSPLLPLVRRRYRSYLTSH